MTAGERRFFRRLAAVVLVLAISYGIGDMAMAADTPATVCHEDMSCWDGRTMGNRTTGERWLGHNGADTWGPNRINWLVLVRWYGPGLQERSI